MRLFHRRPRTPGRRTAQAQTDRLRDEVNAELVALHARHDALAALVNDFVAREQTRDARLASTFRGVYRHVAGVEKRVTALEADDANAAAVDGQPKDLTETQPTSPEAVKALIARNTAATATSLRQRLGPGSGRHLADRGHIPGADTDTVPLPAAEHTTPKETA